MIQSGKNYYYGYIMVFLCFLLMFLSLGSQTSFGVFFKPVLADFDWSRLVTSGAFSLCTIMGGIAGIFLGGLNDRYGPRLVMTLCSVLLVAGYALLYFTRTAWQFYLFFGVIIGIGCCGYAPLLSTVARWFVKRRSMMSGLVFAGAGVGMLIWPLVFNLLIDAYRWRVSSLVVGGIMVTGVIAAQFMQREPAQVGQIPYGENEHKNGTDTDKGGFSLKEALRTRQFWMFSGVLACYGFIFFSLQVHLVPYLTDLKISAASAASVLATVGGGGIVGQIGLGGTGDKIGYKQGFVIGIVMLALGAFILVWGKELWQFYLVAALVGMAFGNCSTQESPIVAWLFGLASHGLILGVFAFTFTIGAAIGPVVSGYVFDSTDSYRWAFLVCAALGVIAVILTALIKPMTSENKREGNTNAQEAGR